MSWERHIRSRHRVLRIWLCVGGALAIGRALTMAKPPVKQQPEDTLISSASRPRKRKGKNLCALARKRIRRHIGCFPTSVSRTRNRHQYLLINLRTKYLRGPLDGFQARGTSACETTDSLQGFCPPNEHRMTCLLACSIRSRIRIACCDGWIATPVCGRSYRDSLAAPIAGATAAV